MAAAAAAAAAAVEGGCDPAAIRPGYDAGCGRFLPIFHPKNTNPLAHNNDANAPFEVGAPAPGLTTGTAGGLARCSRNP